MKQITTLLMFLIFLASAGEKKSCCGPTATEEFAAFGNDMTFVVMHDTPEPFDYISLRGEMKSIKTQDGHDATVYEVMSSEKTDSYIFVFQEWWGLNNYIKQESEKLQRALGNVNVIALDLYDGKIAATPDSARKYVAEVKEERIRTIINAAISYAGKDAEIATIGWCFGGGWSIQAALMLGKQAVGCVIYYGMPEKDVKKLETLNCDVLGIFGTQDAHINPKVVAEFEYNMMLAKRKLSVLNFNAVHAFANPSNPKHDSQMTSEAHEATLTYFKEKFK